MMNWLRRFMMGRYGADQLTFATLLLSMVLVMFTRGAAVAPFGGGFPAAGVGLFPDAVPEHFRPGPGERGVPPVLVPGEKRLDEADRAAPGQSPPLLPLPPVPPAAPGAPGPGENRHHLPPLPP